MNDDDEIYEGLTKMELLSFVGMISIQGARNDVHNKDMLDRLVRIRGKFHKVGLYSFYNDKQNTLDFNEAQLSFLDEIYEIARTTNVGL